MIVYCRVAVHASTVYRSPHLLSFLSRPDTSFLWIMNPMKAFKHIFWQNWKWVIVKLGLLILLIVFLGLFIYNMPRASVDKMYGLL